MQSTNSEKSTNPEVIGKARIYIARKYCESKGWPLEPEKLSIEQVLEIREQPSWKEPNVVRNVEKTFASAKDLFEWMAEIDPAALKVEMEKKYAPNGEPSAGSINLENMQLVVDVLKD